MRTTTIALALGTALALACGVDSDKSGGGSDNAGDTTDVTSATDGNTTTEPSDGTTTTPADAGTTQPNETGVGESSAGTGGSACSPDPTDSSCAMCSKASCCSEIEACDAEEACACMTDCVTGPADLAPCTEQCGDSPGFNALRNCVVGSCLTQCL